MEEPIMKRRRRPSLLASMTSRSVSEIVERPDWSILLVPDDSEAAIVVCPEDPVCDDLVPGDSDSLDPTRSEGIGLDKLVAIRCSRFSKSET